MKKVSRKQYVLTLIVCFAAITVLSVCTITAFYRKAKKDALSLGESAVQLQTEQIDSYLSRAMDAVEVTAITVEYMMRENASSEEILHFLTEESKYYREDIDENFTGIYGWFNGEYLDGIGWTPDEDYVPQDREWYQEAVAGGGKPVMVQPYLDAQTHTVMVSISQLLYDNESVISLDVSLETLQDKTEAIQLNDQGYGFICDKTGLVIAHSDRDQIGKNYQDQDMKDVFSRIQANENADSTFSAKIHNEKVTIFANAVLNEWYVVMVINDDKMFQSIRSLIVSDILISLGVYIIIVIFCTLSMWRTEHTLDQLDATNSELSKTNNTVMQVLAKTIDAKDKYTRGHSVRVAYYSRELAKRMGKSEEEQEKIYRIALLHDVGKIRIPDTIINKPGRLTDQEFSMIKLHTVAGYHILKGSNRFDEMAQGAKYHHERYDGKGYPSGLKGENIPEYARIIAVADSYDAMTSNRIYRDALPQSVVRKEIEKGKGTQFDPEIADIMLQMIDEDKEYKMKQTEELRRKILVVDDDEMNFRVIGNICKEEPLYQIYGAESGKEAVEFLKSQKVDLILLDIEMPGMNGFETFEQIRQITDVPVAFITATRDYDTIEKARKLGVEDYITKPYLPAVFLETIHGIMN